MCNLSWTPPLLEKDNSKNNPVYNTQVWVLTVSEEEMEEDSSVIKLSQRMTKASGMTINVCSCHGNAHFNKLKNESLNLKKNRV